MDYIAVVGIAIGLAMDAFAVSITNGAVTKGIKLKYAAQVAFFFGFFQFIMPVIGWTIGKIGEEMIMSIDHWVAFILLSYIGGKMIYESFNSSEQSVNGERGPINLKTLTALAIATSIDALATGVILPSVIGAETVNCMLIATLIIGAITFFMSFVGVYIGKRFGDMLSSKAGILGGVVLIFMGLKILIEGLFFS